MGLLPGRLEFYDQAGNTGGAWQNHSSASLTVYDIGASTSSLAIECQRLVGPGGLCHRVNPDALELIKLNIRRFNVELQIIVRNSPGSAGSLARSRPDFYRGQRRGD